MNITQAFVRSWQRLMCMSHNNYCCGVNIIQCLGNIKFLFRVYPPLCFCIMTYEVELLPKVINENFKLKEEGWQIGIIVSTALHLLCYSGDYPAITTPIFMWMSSSWTVKWGIEMMKFSPPWQLHLVRTYLANVSTRGSSPSQAGADLGRGLQIILNSPTQLHARLTIAWQCSCYSDYQLCTMNIWPTNPQAVYDGLRGFPALHVGQQNKWSFINRQL